MSTAMANRSRNNNPSNKWKAYNTSMDGWSRDAHPHTLRYANSASCQPNGEQNIKLPEIKSSEETVTCDVGTKLHGHESNLVHANAPSKHNGTVLRRDQRYVHGYPEFNVSQAILAMQRLQRLKELQRRRDLTERYYSQEIRRLIGEHYFGPRLAASTAKTNEKSPNSYLQAYPGDQPRNAFKSLEPCGTMTTITRLDCGCIQETTRPIFTTSSGRVQKKTCNQSQDQVFLKLASSNPQEHLYSPLESCKNAYFLPKSKKRPSLDSKAYAKISEEVDSELETKRNRNNSQKSEIEGRTSRNVSPFRKFSDTSTTSV